MASSDCEITSGGVSSMPNTKHPTIIYGRFGGYANLRLVAPVQIQNHGRNRHLEGNAEGQKQLQHESRE